jgi:hypothetical protein
LGDKRRRKL